MHIGCKRLILIICFALLAAAMGMTSASAAEDTSREFQECAECPVMVGIPAGSFIMGSTEHERGRFDNEGPQHKVAVAAFALGKTTVTIEQYATFLRQTGYQPEPCDRYHGLYWDSRGHGLAFPPGISPPPLWPAYCLNWNDARAYVAWLNSKVAKAARQVSSKSIEGPYRLPTEAEWEYAARGGVTAARWWGATVGEANANCNGCGSPWDGRDLAPVGSFGPNPFGLYDMLGNVWQWTEDCWNDSYIGAPSDGRAWITGACDKRVMRGGSWSSLPVFIRSAARSGNDIKGCDFDYANYAGFRVARSLP